jgi:hypothetical protein
LRIDQERHDPPRVLRRPPLLAQDDHREHVLAGDVGHAHGVHDRAVLHHRHAIAHVEHLVHVVTDEEDADALGLEPADRVAHHAGLGGAQRRARLVHDEDARVEVESARDRHRLALAARHGAHRLPHVAEVGVQPRDHLGGLVLHAVGVECPPRGEELAAEEEVRRRVEVFGQRERLVDGLDSRGARLAGARELAPLAAHYDLALVGGKHPRQHLDERALARAVVAQQAHHLALVERAVDAVYRLQAAEVLRERADLDQAAHRARLLA